MTSGDQLSFENGDHQPQSEAVSLKDAHARLVKLLRRLEIIQNCKVGDPDTLDVLEGEIRNLGSKPSFGASITEALVEFEVAIAESRAKRLDGFSKSVAAYVNQKREANLAIRESATGWRVGILDLELQQSSGLIRFLYNGEEVTSPKSVSSPEDITKLESQARKRLEGSEIQKDWLGLAVVQAFRHVSRERISSGKGNGKTVPVLDFYRELRPALVRAQLMGKKPDVRVALTELPKWQFLYNIDRYRSTQSQDANRPAIRLITGSQQETSRGLSMKFGGLNETDYPKEYCHIEVVEQDSQK